MASTSRVTRDAMEPSKMEEFVANAALLAAHLTEQGNKAASAQQASAQELQASAIVVRKTIEEGKREMSDQARAAVHEALAHEIPAATHSITPKPIGTSTWDHAEPRKRRTSVGASAASAPIRRFTSA